MKIFDISKEILSAKVFPGDTAPVLTRVRDIAGGGYNLSDITMCVHSGTHIDAPLHFYDGGKAVDELPLEIFAGKALVAEMNGVITAERIAKLPLGTRRLLVKGKAWLTAEACEKLAERSVLLVGTESQSVGGRDAAAVHLALLKHEIIPLESVCLEGVPEGEYMLFAQPIKIKGSDGAPVRAVLAVLD